MRLCDDPERFAFFSKAALEFLLQTGKRPDVIHTHDWHTGLVPVLLYELYGGAGLGNQRVCHKIHNFRHQGVTGPQPRTATGLGRPAYFGAPDRMGDDHDDHVINIMRGAIVYASFVTTVSPHHAWEARHTDLGVGLGPTLHRQQAKFGGILNGLDYEPWNPQTDPHLTTGFTSTAAAGRAACRGCADAKTCPAPWKPRARCSTRSSRGPVGRPASAALPRPGCRPPALVEAGRFLLFSAPSSVAQFDNRVQPTRPSGPIGANRQGRPMTGGKHPHIRHIVHLMLENRSLDNVLGWLYENDSPAHVLPRGSCPHFDGLQKHQVVGSADGRERRIIRGTGGRHAVPRFDPNEEYEHVNYQLFRTQVTPPGCTSPTMGGFYEDYAKWYRNNDEILMSYTPEELPVLNMLARRFAVSDRYFSSVPTQTNCNRAFAAAGNSLGRTDRGELKAWVNNRNSNWLARPRGTQFSERTLWNVLDEQGQNLPSDWMIFSSRGNWLENALGAEGYQYTRRIMERLQDPCFDRNFAAVGSADQPADGTLFGMIASGSLPRFSFIEPSWTLPFGPGLGPNGTDYHPPGDIRKGERFLRQLYAALSGNPDIWKSLLLIINFDEHGGTYDHVPPPCTAVPPWHHNSDTPEPLLFEQDFRFDRFGVRVPLILVSPYVREGTVFRADGDVPFDHTSVLATVLHLMGVEKRHWRLGARVDRAPLFHHVLSEHARDDVPGTGGGTTHEPDLSKRLYDSLLADYPDHRADMRPVHAIGIGATGYFVASEAARRYTCAEQFQGGQVPVTVRFSNGSGSPVQHDSALDVRGLAVKFHLRNGGESDLIAITLPVFFAESPAAFLQFAAAGVPRPDPPEGWSRRLLDMLQLRPPARRPDLPEDGTAGVVRYANRHMAARPGTVAATMLVTPSSYGKAAYHALHTFKLIAADGTETFGRFDWEPVAGVEPFPGTGRHDRYLHDELRARLARGPIRFVLRLNVAGQGDDINDPTRVWDTTRLRVVLGELWITDLAADNGAACEHLSFNPTRLAPGIECSDDPVLKARKGAYEYSCRQRGGSGCPVGGDWS